MNIKYNSQIKLESVLLVYLDKKMQKNKLNLISKNGLQWEVPIEEKKRIANNINYYAFIVNEKFCVCDPNCHSIDEVNNMYFSKVANTVKQVKDIELENSVTGKDFQQSTFNIIGKTNVFSNLDIAICYKANLKNILEDSLILFQIINPKGELHFLDFECLKKNKDNGKRIYYAGLKITPLLVEGIWTFQLIFKDKIIDSKEVLYKLYKSNYRKESGYAGNYSLYDVEI
ncbi:MULTISPECIES: hypothetical protein [unclassified Lysinibacillus]|uniref:hypothetical protein n=1 Tax=unclassified Lysinibacillus TaxID=2636778 RepID=UPI003810E9CA